MSEIVKKLENLRCYLQAKMRFSKDQSEREGAVLYVAAVSEAIAALQPGVEVRKTHYLLDGDEAFKFSTQEDSATARRLFEKHHGNNTPAPASSAEREELRKAVEALYFAAHWFPDRPCDAACLWTAVRDAAGIVPGQTAERLGPTAEVNISAVVLRAMQEEWDEWVADTGDIPADFHFTRRPLRLWFTASTWAGNVAEAVAKQICSPAAALLRTPVAVDDAMVDRARAACGYEIAAHDMRFILKAALQAGRK